MDLAWLGWLAWLTEVILALALTIVLLLCVAWLIFSTAWLLANRLPHDIRLWVLENLFRIAPEERASEELISAERHHQSIATWVARRKGLQSTDDLPPDILYKFRLYRGSGASADVSKPTILSNVELRLLMLSLTILNDRNMYWIKRRRNYRRAQVSTWVTIIIGLMTTIMVSLSSTEFGKEPDVSGVAGVVGGVKAPVTTATLIHFLAIILPAIGTAAAAIIAFYAFSAEMARASHTLLNLRQVHSQMALDIWSLKPAEDADSVLETKLQDWVKRYIDIQAVAEAAAPSKDDQSSRPPKDTQSFAQHGELAVPTIQST